MQLKFIPFYIFFILKFSRKNTNRRRPDDIQFIFVCFCQKRNTFILVVAWLPLESSGVLVQERWRLPSQRARFVPVDVNLTVFRPCSAHNHSVTIV